MKNLELDVSFSQERLKTIIEKNSVNIASVELASVCANVCSIIENKKTIDDEILSNITILKKEEKQLLTKFFSSLGRYDSSNQTKEIDLYLAKVNECYNTANEECKKYASLFIKLGAIIGVLVCLIII